MTAEPPRASRQAAPAPEPGDAELIEVTFTPAEPQLARAVLALLRARERVQASDRAESGRT